MKALFSILLFAQFAVAQQSQTAPSSINVLPVRGNLYMLVGAGANAAASIGRDGVLMVDTGTTQMADKLLSTVQQLAYNVVAAPVATTTCVGPTCSGVLSPYGWNSPAFSSTTISRTPPKTIR